MTFGQRFKTARKRLKLTQAEAARLMEVSPRSVWAWEKEDAPTILIQEAAMRRFQDYEMSLKSAEK